MINSIINKNETMEANIIGELKVKVTVCCTLCGCSHRRNLKVDIYKNTQEAIKEAKVELTEKEKKRIHL